MPLPLELSKLFEDLMRNESHREQYNQILARWIQDMTSGLGVTQWVDGVAYIYDPIRSKQVSVNRQIYMAGYYGQNQSDRYLKIEGITTIDNHGVLMPRKALITGIFGKSRSGGNWIVEIKRNDDPTVLAQIQVDSTVGSEMNLDVELEEGDLMQIYMVGSGVDHPTVGVEIAWRN